MKRKRKSVLVACNTLTSVGIGPYADHMAMFYRIGRSFRDIDFHQCFAKRMSIDRFRNFAAKVAVDGGFDYLFFLDDDMQMSGAEVFLKLYAAKYHIIGALNYIRGYPFDPMAFKYVSDDGKTRRLVHLTDEEIDDARQTGKCIIPVGAIGTAVCLIDVKQTFAKMPAPWFLTGPHNTEDIYFCIKAAEYNKRCRIGVHADAITGHVLDPEVVNYHTRKHLQAYYESYMSKADIESARGTGDRAEGYITENILPGLTNEEDTLA
jgi:hypothetical protein